jgi:hypothetical protein
MPGMASLGQSLSSLLARSVSASALSSPARCPTEVGHAAVVRV